MAEPSSTEPGRGSLLHRAGSAAAGVGSLGAGNPRLRAAIQYTLLVLVFGFLALFLVTQWSKLPRYHWHFRPGWLVAGFVTVLVFYSIQPQLWQLVLRALGERGDPVQLRAAWGKALLARYVPTNALMVVGRVVLAERAGITKRVCLASIVYELGIGICGAVIGGAYCVITLPSLRHVPERFVILVLIPTALVGLHPRIFKPLADWGLGKLGREPLPKAIPYRVILRLLPAFVALWLIAGVGLFCFARAIHDVPAHKLAQIASAYPVAFVVSVAAFILPSGLGAREAILAAALKPAVHSLTVATAIAVAFRIFLTACELTFVGIVTLLARRARSLS